ncbi:MAG TPA: HEAT repeat domain-containing protein [Anaeromyxobacter sp.]|nr:HEAT repeat domain-containing protein [Anaeromyxobacter sp.]
MADPLKSTETPKTGSSRPPPLPPSAARTAVAPSGKPGALARLKAFLVIRKIRVEAWVRRRPILTATIAALLVLGGAAGAYVAVEGVPELDVEVDLFAPQTISEARAAVRARPADPGAHRALGHALWAKRKRHAALLSYGRALALDKGAADGDMADHLVASFGGRDQDLAEALIWKNKIVGAQDGLEALVKSPRRKVRWGAVHTLDKLEKGTRGNWETAYVLDLDSSDCDVRRNAVEKLGAIGTKRSIAALRAERADDEKTGGWFKSRCLGDRLDEAEQKILARR